MKNKFRALIASVPALALIMSSATAAFAAALPEPVKVNASSIDGLNQTFSTTEHVDSKGIGDDLQTIGYEAPNTFPYVVEYDMTINTPLYAGSIDKGQRNAFGMGLADTAKTNESGYFMVTGSTETTATIIWKTSGTATLGTINVGETYTVRMMVYANNTIKMTWVDSNGVSKSVAGLGLRNDTSSGLCLVTISQNARENGVEDSVTISNAKVYTPGPDDIKLTYNNKTMSTTAKTDILYDPSATSYDFSAVISTEGTETSDFEYSLALTAVDDPEVAYENEFISVDASSLKVDDNIPVGAYDFALKANIVGYPDIYVSFPVTLTVGDASEALQKVVDATEPLTAENKALEKNEAGEYIVTDDLYLKSGSTSLPVSWKCEQSDDGEKWVASNLIQSNGKIQPTNYTGKLRLVADFEYHENKMTRTYPISIINAETTFIDPAIDALSVQSADNAEEVTLLKEWKTLSNDVILPTSYDVALGELNVSWASDSDIINIDKDKAEIMLSDTDEHTVNLTATYAYVKDGNTLLTKEVKYPISIQFTAEYLDKYKVRFDVANEDNFDAIPSSTTSDIKLPTEGKFGSKITWTSDAPTVISNSGAVKRPSSTRTVTLSASIMSGAASEGKDFKVSVSGSKSSSGGGGGGGGGGSISSVGTINNPSTGTLPNDLAPSTVDPTISGSDRTEQLAEEALQATDLFKDLSQASWARAEINALAAAGIINGKSETLFAPNDNVTRAEFAKMLMGAFNLASSGSFASSSFNDVSTSAWYFDSVETAYNLCIINGVSDTEFSPNANITRQDMAVMVMRAAKATSKVPEAVVEAANFADSGSIADYAKEAVDTLQRAGIINGMTDTTFAPNGNATRAQAAKILYAFLNK